MPFIIQVKPEKEKNIIALLSKHGRKELTPSGMKGLILYEVQPPEFASEIPGVLSISEISVETVAKLGRNNPTDNSQRPLEAGEMARITRGAYQGFVGLVSGCRGDRIFLHLSVYGKALFIPVDSLDIERVEPGDLWK